MDGGLVELVKSTGGDVLYISSLKEAQRTMKTLLDGMTSAGPTVTLKLNAVDAAGSNSLGIFPALGKVIASGGNSDAFIPEDNLMEGAWILCPKEAVYPRLSCSVYCLLRYTAGAVRRHYPRHKNA